MRQVTHLETHPQYAGNLAKIFGSPVSPYLSPVAPGVEMPYGFGELSGVDVHRAGRGAHAVDGAGEFSLIDVVILHFLEPGSVFASRSQSGNFTLDDNALPGRQGKIF